MTRSDLQSPDASTQAAATAAVAGFIAGTPADVIPAAAIEPAKKVIADSFAAILSGVNSELGEPMRAYLADTPAGASRVLGTARSAPPALAAFVNGTYAAALDYDDLMTPMHPSAVIVAALCAAVGGARVSGRQFIEAYIIGLEVGARIADALTRDHSNRGFHATATLAAFSAYAGVARLKGSSAAQIANGLGLVATTAGGLLCNLGTMAKPMHSGIAAQRAINAEHMTRCGFTASPVVLETTNGFFAAYGGARSSAAAVAGLLGRPWAVLDPGSTLKRFAAAIVAHRPMAAVLELKRQGLTADNLASLDCAVAPTTLQPMMYPDPKTGFESKFSVPYAIAAALLDERIGIASFETPAVQRPAVRELLARIRAWEDPKQDAEDPVSARLSWGYRGYVRVTATLKDGRTLSSRVDLPPGHPGSPLSWADLQDKMLDCGASAGFSDAELTPVFAQLRALEECAGVDALLAALQKRG